MAPTKSPSFMHWLPRLRKNGVDTDGAAAKVMRFDRLHMHVWGDKGRLTGVPKKFPCQKQDICSDPISADPIDPFPRRRGPTDDERRRAVSTEAPLVPTPLVLTPSVLTPSVLTPFAPFRLPLRRHFSAVFDFSACFLCRSFFR